MEAVNTAAPLSFEQLKIRRNGELRFCGLKFLIFKGVKLFFEHSVEAFCDGADIFTHGASCASADHFSRFHRFIHADALQNFFVKECGELLVYEQIEFIQRLVVFDAVADDLTRNGVSVAERHAFLYEVIGNVGRRREAACRRVAHFARIERNILQQFVENTEAAEDGRFCVKQGFFVFLKIFIVGKGDAFDDGKDRREVSVNSARFAANEFGDIGILFLRHDGRTGGIFVRDVDKTEFFGRIINDIFGEPRKVSHDRGAAENVFGDKIAVGNGVDGILRDLREGKQTCCHSAVDREIGTGHSAAAEGHHVGAFIAIGEAFDVAQEHFAVSVDVLSDGNRLSPAHMRITGHDILNIVVGDIQERVYKRFEVSADIDNAVFDIQTKVGCDLIVARTRGVQHFAGCTDALCEFLFDEGVDIFRAFQRQTAFFDIGENIYESVADLVRTFFGNDLRFSKHLDVRDACQNIMPIQFVVERKRLVEIIGALCARLCKTSFPQFHNLTLRNFFKPISIDLFRRKL